MTTSPVCERWLGEWWLPGSPNKPLSGILTYSPIHGAELELVGAFRSPLLDAPSGEIPDAYVEANGTYGRVVGIAGGQHFTLEGCFRRYLSDALSIEPGLVVETLHVSQIIRGARYEQHEPLEVAAVHATIHNLNTWAGIDRLTTSFEPRRADSGTFPQHTIQTGPASTGFKIKLPDNRQLELRDFVAMSQTARSEIRFTRTASVTISGPAASIESYLKSLSTFQALVTIGTGTAAFVTALDVEPAAAHDRPPSADAEKRLQLYAQWIGWSATAKADPRPADIWCTLSDIGGPPAVERWFGFASSRTEPIGRCLAAKFHAERLASDHFLDVAAGLEQLHKAGHFDQDAAASEKSTSRDKYFGERITDLADDVDPEFRSSLSTIKTWAKDVKKARNCIAHHDTSKHAFSARDLWLADTLHVLFVLYVLKQIGAEAPATDRVLTHRKFEQAVRRLAEQPNESTTYAS